MWQGKNAENNNIENNSCIEMSRVQVLKMIIYETTNLIHTLTIASTFTVLIFAFDIFMFRHFYLSTKVGLTGSLTC